MQLNPNHPVEYYLSNGNSKNTIFLKRKRHMKTLVENTCCQDGRLIKRGFGTGSSKTRSVSTHDTPGALCIYEWDSPGGAPVVAIPSLARTDRYAQTVLFHAYDNMQSVKAR